jgi:hypothetical protein
MRILCPRRFLLVSLLFFGAGLAPVLAQLQVGLSLPRSMFIRYEPLLVTVSITNLSGRPLLLADSAGTPWFSFQIQSENGRPIPTRLSGYSKDPVAIGPGETLRRSVNLTPLYALDDFGRYSIRVSIFDASSGRHFSSRPTNFEITEGRTLWQEMVGHPDDGSQRLITLLAHRLPNSTAAYLRIQDPKNGRVFCTHRLGSLVTYGSPQVELDVNNEVHVLQMRAPRTFIYSHIGLNGEVRQRMAFEQTSTKPSLQRGASGEVLVVGGRPFDPARQEAESQVPGVGDRPVPLPGAGGPVVAPTAEPSPSPRSGGGINLWPFGRRSE